MVLGVGLLRKHYSNGQGHDEDRKRRETYLFIIPGWGPGPFQFTIEPGSRERRLFYFTFIHNLTVTNAVVGVTPAAARVVDDAVGDLFTASQFFSSRNYHVPRSLGEREFICVQTQGALDNRCYQHRGALSGRPSGRPPSRSS